MTNAEISQAFEKIGYILNLLDENPFRVRAYERAAQTISSMTEDLGKVYREKGVDGLEEIPGIGKDLAQKIEEMVTTNELKYLSELKKKVPEGLLELTTIQSMGPKKTKQLWKTYKVTNIDELEKFLKTGTLETVKGWGEKSVQNILLGIEAKRTHDSRIALPLALGMAESLVRDLQKTKLCTQLEIAGSVRRRKESIGDIDILAVSTKVEKVMDAFCTHPLVDRVLAKGETRSSVRLKTGINADLRVVEANVFGAALHYFTGSKEHNIAIRNIGIKKGLTISEYGVYEGSAAKKGKLVASKTEQDVYKAVGLPYIPPELREGRGEIEAANNDELPMPLEVSDLKGDLHMHTTFSDGSATMQEMAKAAKELGHSYMAITDHASPMGMVKGIKEDNIDEYLAAIDEVRWNVKGIEILAGAEVDIMEDGSLYLSDAVLKKLDWVVVSVHGHFNMPSAEMTRRILRALDHPSVRVFAHPTSRLLLKRDPIEYDFDTVFRHAAERNIALELNASIQRLDLNDMLCKRAKEAGANIIINSDAHSVRDLQYRFAIFQARRGWLAKEDIVNTLSWKEFDKWRRRPR